MSTDSDTCGGFDVAHDRPCFPTDLMALKGTKGSNDKPKIEQFIGDVSAYSFVLSRNVYALLAPTKHPSPTAQLDTVNLIRPGADTY